MSNDYLPSTDTDLLVWAQAFSGLITAGPTAYGLTSSIATTLASKVSSYSSALSAARNDSTRGKATVYAKNTAKKDMVAYIRVQAKVIQANPSVTNQQRLDLGLTVRSQSSPIPIPSEAPEVDIVSVVGRTVKTRIHGTDSARRGKPAGVSGAQVYTYLGPIAPEDPALWTFNGATTRTVFDVVFPLSVTAGTQVWIKACWTNERNMCGPSSPAIPTYLQIGNVSEAA